MKGTLHMLQRKLMKRLTHEDYQIDNFYERKAMLRNHLSSLKALVILDHADHVTQVASSLDWYGEYFEATICQ